MNRILLYIFLFYSNFFVFSQEITGKVVEIIDNEEMPVVGANVYWIDNSGGTISNIDGEFKLENSKIIVYSLLVMLDIKMIHLRLVILFLKLFSKRI